jgi:pyruvate dehydrogenase (quinone)
MMARTTADLLVERLIAWDVRVVFGLPGDGIMEALRIGLDPIAWTV